MAINTYATLKTAVATWVGGGETATAATLGLTNTIDDLVTIAESRIFREAKTKDTEASFSTAIASGVVAVPSDYIAAKFLYVDSVPTQIMGPRSSEWIYQTYPTRSSEGKPKYFAREVTNFIFGPFPDSLYTIKGVYYKRLAALSSAAHALFTNNPDLYLFGCLAETAILIGPDPRIPLWEQKYQKILSDVNGHSKNSEYAGGTLRMRIS